MAAPILLGKVIAPLWPYLVKALTEKGVPAIKEVLSDPTGVATRVGDLVVWNGTNGQRVIAGLQTLSESQERIEQTITGIETAQIAMESSLGALQTLSMASLGIVSLSGSFMLWRLQALNKRFDMLIQRIEDLEENLDAQNKAHLKTSVQKLREFDDTGDEELLRRARDEAQHAANVYGQLAHKESQRRRPRLPVLNYRSRCYFLSLVSELRSRILLGSTTEACARFAEEKECLQSVARTCFTHAIQQNPAAFLSPDLKDQGVTLELLTEIYQHAHRLGAVNEVEIRTPAEMFEYCRHKGIRRHLKSWYWPFGGNRQQYLARIRYLIACLEDIGRVEALSLLARTAEKTNTPVSALQKQLRDWCSVNRTSETDTGILAYSFG